MNWAAISFDWNQIRAFWATVDEGSFSAVARALGLAQPPLGRQMAVLGVTLFERAGRSPTLTQVGRELLRHTRAMGEAAQRISLAASGAAPGIEIDLVAANDIRDLQRREADIAIRHVRPEQPGLTAKRVQEARARAYAASTYLDARGRPGAPAELAGHDFISFGDVERMVSFLTPLGFPVTAANFRAGSENGVVAWENGAPGAWHRRHVR